jgi:hypothetical protein
MKNKNKMFSSKCLSAFEDFVEKNIAVFYSTANDEQWKDYSVRKMNLQ